MASDDKVPTARVTVGLLLGLAAVYFGPVLSKGSDVVLSRPGTDTWSQYFYWREFGFASLAKGEIPLWNPYIFSGTPYFAGLQSALFYPPNIVYLFFDTPFAINLSIALHCFFGSLFTFGFARYLAISRAGALLAALAFTYGAPFFLHIYPGHLSNLSTMIWLPLLLMNVEAFLRTKQMRNLLLGGLTLAMQALAGHPQYLFYSTIAVTLYFVLRLLVGGKCMTRDLVRYAAGYCLLVLTGVALAAVQLLPALEFTIHSARQALTYDWVSSFSLPPENLITLLLPDFFGDMLEVPYWGKNYLWEMSLYMGAIPVIMVAAALFLNRTRETLIFALIGAVSLLLALGKYTPLLSFLYTAVPGFNLFRGLSKFAFVFAFAVSMLAGLGLTKVTALAEERSPKLRQFSYGVLAVALLFVVLGLANLIGHELWASLVQSYERGEESYTPLPSFNNDFFLASLALVSKNVFSMIVITLLLGGLLLCFDKFKKLAKGRLPVAILIIAVLDLWIYGSRYLITFDPTRVRMDRDLKAFFKNDKEAFRVATPIFSLANTGMIENLENVGGYDAIVLKNYSEFVNFSQELPMVEPNTAMIIGKVSPLLNLLNVKYYILDSGVNVAVPGLSLVYQNPRYNVYSNLDALPRSFVVHDISVMSDPAVILRRLASPGFTSMATAVVEEHPEGILHDKAVQGPLPVITEYSPNRVVIQADLRTTGLLVLADSFYPGWKAFVDGLERKIYRTNYVMRGVLVSGGRHVVEFRYDPNSFKIGALTSLISLVFVIAYLIRLKVLSSPQTLKSRPVGVAVKPRRVRK